MLPLPGPAASASAPAPCSPLRRANWSKRHSGELVEAAQRRRHLLDRQRSRLVRKPAAQPAHGATAGNRRRSILPLGLQDMGCARTTTMATSICAARPVRQAGAGISSSNSSAMVFLENALRQGIHDSEKAQLAHRHWSINTAELVT
jgi:hypothetical protein